MKSKIIIAVILLLFVSFTEAQILDSSFKYYNLGWFSNMPKNKPTSIDTIPVLLLVCDTNTKYKVFAGNVFLHSPKHFLSDGSRFNISCKNNNLSKVHVCIHGIVCLIE